MSNIYSSQHKGRAIDQSVKDVAELKTDMAQTKVDIDYLNTHKANSNTVPKSIKDLEPNASLVYTGKDEPPSHFNLWIYPINDTVAILRARDANGKWVSIVEDNTYIVTLGFEYEMNEDGGYTITDELKHNDVRVGADDIFNAYKSGNTVILIANGNDIFQLTSARPVDDTALIEFSRTNNSEHWTIEVYGNGAWVISHTGSMEDVNHKVWETDIAGVEQYEESFEKYPSMMSMIGYVKDKVNSIKPYIVTLGFDYEINPETGGYYITDPPKHNRRQVTSNDIYEAYQAGRTVVLIANDAIVCPLTDRIVIDTDYYGVRFTGFYDSDSRLNIEILDTSCRVTDAKVEDERNKVWAWELDEDEGGNLEDAFKDGRYPSMGAMVKYVEGITNPIVTAVAKKSDVIKMKTDTVKIHKITDCEPTAFEKLYLYGSAINPKTNPTIKVLGKNLIPYPHARQEYIKNGITFTENGDGTVTVDGTAEDDARYTLIGGNGMRLDYGTYCLSGCPKDGSPATYYLSVSGTSSGEGFSKDTGIGASFVSDAEGSSIYPQIWIKKGYKARNLVFKPMIEVGSIETEYEPYVETQKVTIPYKFAKVTDKLVLKDGTVKTIIDGVTEDITNTECGKALRNLHTNFPTTTILCDADCNVTYTVNAKNAYCSLLDEIDILKQAIISLGGKL